MGGSGPSSVTLPQGPLPGPLPPSCPYRYPPLPFHARCPLSCFHSFSGEHTATSGGWTGQVCCCLTCGARAGAEVLHTSGHGWPAGPLLGHSLEPAQCSVSQWQSSHPSCVPWGLACGAGSVGSGLRAIFAGWFSPGSWAGPVSSCSVWLWAPPSPSGHSLGLPYACPRVLARPPGNRSLGPAALTRPHLVQAQLHGVWRAV